MSFTKLVSLVERRVTSKNPRFKRRYDGAEFGRLLADWAATGASVDTEVKGALVTLRNRSRELCRNNDHAKSAIRAYGNNVIGEGVRMQAQVKKQRGKKLDESVNKQIELQWEKWGKKINCHTAGAMDLHDMAKMLLEQIMESGEIYVRFVFQRMGDSKVPLALEVIECDKLDDTYNERLKGEFYVRMGVKKNEWGRPISYFFLKNHPGDMMPNSSIVGRFRQEVPAAEVIPLFPHIRPDQSRGIPVLASAMTRLHHMKGYEQSEVISARATSALMAFVESPTGEAPADDEQDGERLTDFESGVFKYLGPGEKIVVPQLQRPGGQFEPFMRAMIRGLSAGSGVSYETVSRDYSQSNYSSTRQALLDDRDNYRIIQKWFIRNFYQLVFDKWLDLAVTSEAVTIKNYWLDPDLYKAVKWLPRGWSWIDPLKEVLAFKAAVRSGFMTQEQVISQLGGDYDEMMLQRQREIELAKEYGLTFDTDPGAVSDTGKSQADPTSPGDGTTDPTDDASQETDEPAKA